MRVIRCPNPKYSAERWGEVFYKGRAQVEDDDKAAEMVALLHYTDVTEDELGKPIKRSFAAQREA